MMIWIAYNEFVSLTAHSNFLFSSDCFMLCYLRCSLHGDNITYTLHTPHISTQINIENQ